MTDEQYIEGLKAKFKITDDEAPASNNNTDSSSKNLPRREVRDMGLYDTLGDLLPLNVLTHSLTHSLNQITRC